MKKSSSPKHKPYIAKNGYRHQYCPKSPSANKNGYAPTHRIMAENKVGGAIFPGNVVHHRDGNKLNNSRGNLQVMPARRHISLHGLQFRKKIK